MAITDGDTVTLEYTGRLDDGTVFDTSLEAVASEHGLAEENPKREYQPLTVEIGDGQIIEGLESALHGMDAGDEATVTVAPEDAYGERTEDRVVEYETDDLESMLDRPVEEGMAVQTEEGLPGTVVSVEDDVSEVDYNHELAGEALEFEIEIVGVQ